MIGQDEQKKMSTASEMESIMESAGFFRVLMQWFSEHARKLPWRENVSAYHVWVSEIMLQQTRVEAVIPYYERFLGELPDVRSLALCEEDHLLKLWEGLGYYNRVRNMQKAARKIVAQYGGEIPADYNALLKLPGIGSYTAGAVASIAFGIPVPAVDGNVLRVLMRMYGDDSDIAKESVKKRVREFLYAVMQRMAAAENFHPGTLNQALMELGALICLPNGAPLCVECPWKKSCRARIEQRTGQLPVKTAPKKRRKEKKTVLIVRDDTRIILHKRPDHGLLAGLYEYPNFDGFLTETEALEEVRKMHLQPLKIEKLAAARHIFSHVEWDMRGYAIRVDSLTRDASPMTFVEIQEAGEHYPIPSAFAAYSHYLQGLNRS